MDSPPVSFHSQNITFQPKQPQQLKNWLNNSIIEEGKELEHLNIIFCDDNYLHALNKKYLGHDTFTDVITFPLSEKKETLEGDIFISIDRITENSSNFKATFDEELRRVMIHGVLHLLGYKDNTPTEKTRIKEKEDHYLTLIG